MRSRTTTAVLLAGLFACSRPQPSPDYEQARQLWTTVVQERGEDAGDDPRAGQVLSLLDRVPGDSLDAAPAADIRSRIKSMRAAKAAERERLARLLADLDKPTTTPPQDSGGPATPASARPAAPDLALGMKLDEFRAKYGECVQAKGPVKLAAADGSARDAEMWVLKGGDACRAQHPQLADRAAVFVDGAVASVSPLSSMRTEEVRRTVELAPLPGGGQGMVVDGKVVPLPPGSKIVEGGDGPGVSGAEPPMSKSAKPAPASGASTSAAGKVVPLPSGADAGAAAGGGR